MLYKCSKNKWQTFTVSQIELRIILLPLFFLLTGSGFTSSATTEAELIVGEFGVGSLKGWQEKSFKGKTFYKFVKGHKGLVLKADSNESASGLFRKIKIDLVKRPCLIWSWKVDKILDGLDETTKDGDDYPARMYVIFSEGLLFWKTRALNYVWSNGRPLGSIWPNAHAKSSINIAVQSGQDKVGQWTQQMRNIRSDFKRFIGGDVKQVDGIAIMTDTDNSGGIATAFYGDVRFSSKCTD